ncbi:MAG: signal peptidase I [Bacilli bacterium]|nr:signal peptidase I [Bacilli bacterium]MDD4808702.1 signal peptidase I [Bacilli bacterium]
MKKLLFILMMIIIFIYLLAYQWFFRYYGDLISYVVNPLVWLGLSLISYLLLYERYTFKYRKTISYIVISSSFIYIITYYALGLVTGYTNNPYLITISGIVINTFSILFVILYKEYLRYVLLMTSNKYNYVYKIFIYLLFFLSDLNILFIIRQLINSVTTFNILGETVIPVLSINLFMMYLCQKGGYIVSSLYRLIIILPSLLIPIMPKVDWIIPALFNVLFPLFTYLVIEYMINKRNKKVPINVVEEFNPKNWILTFIIAIIIIMFGLGSFGVKPSVILTKSMEPSIKPGDLIIIQPININEIKAGDIIQYKTNDYHVVHRVVRVLKDNDSILLVTKGDNNLSIDQLPVKEDQLLGKMKYHIPIIGYPSYLLHQIIGSKVVDIEIGK